MHYGLRIKVRYNTHAYLPEHADYLRRRAANMFEKQWFQTLIAEPIPHKQRPLQ